jgi:hypothetical protein
MRVLKSADTAQAEVFSRTHPTRCLRRARYACFIKQTREKISTAEAFFAANNYPRRSQEQKTNFPKNQVMPELMFSIISVCITTCEFVFLWPPPASERKKVVGHYLPMASAQARAQREGCQVFKVDLRVELVNLAS